ncbi:MAG: polysaccharide deacetylase family protein [Hyphomicrobiales bacterium]|nr:polysaccharide deacetylase family protein [Hyphomicrobiales bacterium]
MARMSDRIPFSALPDRKPLRLPGGEAVAVWVIVNVEEWSIERAMPRTVLPPPMGGMQLPDVPNWAWHEYGMRVGFWRFAEALEKAGIRATLALNGRVCEVYPRVAEEAHRLGWEFMGHGWEQRPMHAVEDQPEEIARSIAAITAVTGKAPRGWESPGLTETPETLDHLRAAGIEYVANWPLDDEPVEMRTTHGPIVAMPYTVELNDIPIGVIQHHQSDVLLKRGIDQFERLALEGERSARVMAISIHPYMTGAAHRIRYLEELLNFIGRSGKACFMAGDEILDWWRTQPGLALIE